MIEEATEDMLMIDPPPASSMAGRKARIVRYIDLTLRSNETSQSASSQSFAPTMASLVKIPRYSVMGCPSRDGVVETIM